MKSAINLEDPHVKKGKQTSKTEQTNQIIKSPEL